MIVIETSRLKIRPPMAGDAKPINDAINRSLPELQRWMPWAFDPRLETTEEFVRKGIESWESENQSDFPMVVVLKDSDTIISASGYNDRSDPSVPFYEIGYWLESRYVGKGYATELTNAITRFAFDHFNAVRVQIRTQRENSKSVAVARRCGYQQEAILHKAKRDCRTSEPCDDLIFACFSTDSLPECNYTIKKV